VDDGHRRRAGPSGERDIDLRRDAAIAVDVPQV
jgi:hypothetical protein